MWKESHNEKKNCTTGIFGLKTGNLSCLGSVGGAFCFIWAFGTPRGEGGQKEKLICDRSILIKHCLSNTDPTSIQRQQKKTGILEIPKYFGGLYKGDSDRVPNSLECLMELNLHQWRIVNQTVNGERYQRAREKKESIIGPNRICFPWLPSTSAQPLQSLGLSMCSVPPFTPFYFPKGSLHSFYFFSLITVSL